MAWWEFYCGWQNGFGNVVYVKHTNASHVTVYGHLSRIDVQKGQRVEQGDGIGAVGSHRLVHRAALAL